MDFMSATFDNIKLTTKQQRSDSDQDDQTLKPSRTHYFDQPSKSMSMRSDPLLSLSASDANNMLCFSSSVKDANHTSLFSLYQPPSSTYIKNTGFGYGGLPVSRYKGPLTPSQWMELEHQALIYKHFVANVPVPSHLLSPLTKSLNTFLFPGSSPSPNSYGWGSFQLGFSGNTDPEPGRCRRTDGKKWRCSRDAVPDQKYCERHINRGRHRSRKPVEGQDGHAVTNAAASKAAPVVSSSSTTTRPTTVHNHNPAVAAPTQTPISSTQASDSLMYGTSYTSFMDQGAANPSPNPLPNFVDVWSKDELIKREWTQLSMATSDFSSCSNSPAQEKLMVPSLGLTPEFQLEPAHKPTSNWIPFSWGGSMGGPLGEVLNRTSGTSEVKVKNLSSGSEMNSLNQMTEMWDAVNHHMGSSPTGVLTKTTFVSLSNCSSSSPKGNKTNEHGGGSLCDEMLLSTLAS